MDQLVARGQIQAKLRDYRGFEEIDSKAQSRIVTDVYVHFGQTHWMWPNAEEFTRNYVRWVFRHIFDLLVEEHTKTEMWSMWAQTLEELYIPQ